MNSRFIFNAISVIQFFILNNKVQDAIVYISELASFMRRTLENSKKPIIPIEDAIETLNEYLNLELKRLDNGFDYQLRNELKSKEVWIPSMLLQPFVEDVILHGFKALGKKGKLFICFSECGNMIKLTIIDNGLRRKGVDIFTRKDKSQNFTLKNIEIQNKSVGKRTQIEIMFPNDY